MRWLSLVLVGRSLTVSTAPGVPPLVNDGDLNA
jgi:hypothetical protein